MSSIKKALALESLAVAEYDGAFFDEIHLNFHGRFHALNSQNISIQAFELYLTV
jgi:hypothetical protein